MVDDFQATVVIGLLLISFFSVVWALIELLKRKEMETKWRNANKNLYKYRLEEYYEKERQKLSEKFKELDR